MSRISTMLKKTLINMSFILLLAFHYSACIAALPISHIKSRQKPRKFQVSKWRIASVLCAFISEGAFIYISFFYLKNCAATSDCAQSYVSLLEACYAFTLLFITLFATPNSLCHLLTTLLSHLTSNYQVDKRFFFIALIKCFSLYFFIIIEFLRKILLEDFRTSLLDIVQTVFLYYTKCLIHSFDNLLLTFLCLLEIKFYILNHRLGLTITSRRTLTQIHVLLSDHWHTIATLKEVATCAGPLFLGTLVYKQLQVAGMIYFNLLSNLPDDGNDLYQILDLFLPIFVLTSICFETSEVLSQIISYTQLLNYRKIRITACNFIVIRAGLMVKVGFYRDDGADDDAFSIDENSDDD